MPRAYSIYTIGFNYLNNKRIFEQQKNEPAKTTDSFTDNSIVDFIPTFLQFFNISTEFTKFPFYKQQ